MWTPNESDLQHVSNLLNQSHTGETTVQIQIQRAIAELNKHPDFGNYLMYVFAKKTDEDVSTRSISGLILKNNIRNNFANISESTIEYVKSEVLNVLNDNFSSIRSTASILIASIAAKYDANSWPELLPTLCDLIDSNNLMSCESAFDVLKNICEDSVTFFNTLLSDNSFSNFLLKLLNYFRHQNPRIRIHALQCVNKLMVHKNDIMLSHRDLFLENLFFLFQDEDAEVRKNVCRALVMLLEINIDILIPHFFNVFEYMLTCTQDKDESVALEASEFWLTLSEQSICKFILGDHVNRLIPILIRGMKYSEEDVVLLTADVADEHIPDKDDDIKPRFHKQKLHGKITSCGTFVPNMPINIEELEKEEDDDKFSHSSDLEADATSFFCDEVHSITDWNLRKCSAACLDCFSNSFGNDILPVLLPILKELLFSNDWLLKESGILALGAIAEGCVSGLDEHLHNLVPYLIQSLNDKKALVRSITCWTLSRYSHWIVVKGNEAMLSQLVYELLTRILDSNKRVQEAACSAFATLEEEACISLVPYLDQILQTLVFAFTKYQNKNLMILYDAIGTLAESVGSHLSTPEYISMLMPPLIDKWNQLKDHDKDLFPLLECLGSVASSLQLGFLPYCKPVYVRCLLLMEQTLQQQAQHLQNPNEIDPPDRDFLVASLDLLSGLAEGLGEHMQDLVANSNLIQLLFECSRDTMPEVRQSTFALLGDITKSCYPCISTFVPNFFPSLGTNLTSDSVSVINNATWAIGEICLKMEAATKPFISYVLMPLIANINNANMPRTLLENTSITIGRLGYVCPNDVAPHLPRFFQPWCKALREVRDNSEKESAFHGLCRMIEVNPVGVVNDFMILCDAIVSWSNPNEQLRNMFHNILHGFKNQASAENWNQFSGQFPPQLRQRLSECYNI